MRQSDQPKHLTEIQRQRRDYRLKVQNCYLSFPELQDQKDMYTSLISQFNSYKSKIKLAIETIYPQDDETIYNTLIFLSQIWKSISPVSNVIKLDKYYQPEQVQRTINRMRRWQNIYTQCFKMLNFQNDFKIKFPIQTNESKQAKKILDDILGGGICMTIGLKDIAVLIEKIKERKLDHIEGLKFLISNIILSNNNVEPQTFFINSQQLHSLSKQLQSISLCKLECSKLELDANIVRKIIGQQTKSNKNKYISQNSQFWKRKTQYEKLENEYNNAPNLNYQCQVALKMEIMYANMINSYYHLFKLNTQNQAHQKEIDLTGTNIIKQLIQKIGKPQIDLSIRTQIGLALNQIKRYYFGNLTQIFNNKDLIANQTYLLEGNSKLWTLYWKRKNKKYALSSKHLDQEQQTIKIKKMSSEMRRQTFKENLQNMYKRLHSQGVKQELNMYNQDFYQLFVYEEAGIGMKKVLSFKQDKLANKFEII